MHSGQSIIETLAQIQQPQLPRKTPAAFHCKSVVAIFDHTSSVCSEGRMLHMRLLATDSSIRWLSRILFA